MLEAELAQQRDDLLGQLTITIAQFALELAEALVVGGFIHLAQQFESLARILQELIWQICLQSQIDVDFDEKGSLYTGLLARMWSVMRPQRWLISASLVLLLITQALRIAQPLLVALAIYLYLAPQAAQGRWANVVGLWRSVETRVQ